MEQQKAKLFQALTALALLVSVLVIARIVTEIKGYRFIGGGVSATNTISVSGDGEVFAAPDIAQISFTVRADAKKVSDAQGKVTMKVKAALATVRALGVADKDIKTQNYSSYPKYEWQEATVSCMGLNCLPAAASAQAGPPSRPGRQVVVGYEVSQSVMLTVRDSESVNAVVDALATAGVTDMQGPSFAIDKEDDLKAEARKQAIDKSRAKAEVLASDLGVSLIRIVSFSEGGNYPIYSRVMMTAGAEKADSSAPMPELPQGEEKITASVTVTYEIR